ncbi:PREDICTED: uncharacterized protein LOC109337710 [Lupinus angustifolius]|uniref:uncharacterized protein LOC109337710 n=1 Tax=Lupinus angustifolius TaxID=3871 RepID=UPI00092EF697|nr:PREDICTED: uncharacterized protein LOC109337710 [Lupinus angustifolius]
MPFCMVTSMKMFTWMFLRVLFALSQIRFVNFISPFYGLKRAGRQWYNKLSNSLKQLGYTQSSHDHSLFTKNRNQYFTALLIYVDDLVLSGNDMHEIMLVKQHLDKQFKIKDLGKLKYFLGLEVARSKSGITLYQRKYALDILSDTGFLVAKLVPSPMVKTTRLHQDNTTCFEDPSLYRRLVGRLLYLTNTRHDISYFVQQLSQFMAQPTITHYKALTQVLRYIKGIPGQRIFYSSMSPLKLKASNDSDWAVCIDSRKSKTGCCVFLGNSLI